MGHPASFADKKLQLSVQHAVGDDDPYLELSGFSGDTSRSSARAFLDQVRATKADT
jgi:hypothetical protein